MFILATLGIAVVLTAAIWVWTYSDPSTGSAAEDSMRAIPAMFVTVAIWVVIVFMLLIHWLVKIL